MNINVKNNYICNIWLNSNGVVNDKYELVFLNHAHYFLPCHKDFCNVIFFVINFYEL